MPGKRSPVSWWEVAEMVYERRDGMAWDQIGLAHGISGHKAKREVEGFARLARSRRAHGNKAVTA